MTAQRDFRDGVYVVTGAGHAPGVGSSVVQLLLDQGARVVVNSRNFDTGWHDHLSALPSVLIVPGDICLADIQQDVIDRALNRWERLDGIVNNASTGPADFDAQGLITRDTWQSNFLVNCVAVYEFSMRCRQHLSASKGSIVNIASRAAIKAGSGNNVAYAVSKSALVRLTQELALQFSPDITVNSVSPGLVASARIQQIMGQGYEGFQQHWRKISDLPGPIEPKEIAHTVLLCLASHSLTGQNIPICGIAAM